MTDTFKCEACNSTFTKGWTDEEAIDEYEEQFPKEQGPIAVICHNCYVDMMIFMNSKSN